MTTQTQDIPAAEDPRDLLEDWLTIWQSELAGLVVDREMQAAAVRMGAAWATVMRSGALLAWGTGHEPAAGPAGPDAAPGAAAVAAASHRAGGGGVDERDGVIEQLLARVAELERRVGGDAPG